jgi:hypothetical protein
MIRRYQQIGLEGQGTEPATDENVPSASWLGWAVGSS